MPSEYKVLNRDGELVDVCDNRIDAKVQAALSPVGETYRVEERHYNTTEENNAEDNDDDTTNMNYNFIAADDDAQDDTNDFNAVGSMWTLGNHSAVSTENSQNLVDSIDGVMGEVDSEVDDDIIGVLQNARDVVSNASVSRFECPVEECGLGHSHSDHKHDIRAGFGVTDAFADQMDFCPYCHCGVNELAMLMSFYPYIDAEVFGDRDFSAISQINPGTVDRLWTFYDEGHDINEAIAQVATEQGVSNPALVGDEAREALRQLFSLREDINNAADSAPIAQQTRRVIGENSDSIEVALTE